MHVFQEWRDRLQRWTGAGKFKNARLRRILLGGLFFALLTLILSGQVSPQGLDLQVGALAPISLPAPRDIENRLATERSRENAAAAIPMQKKIDSVVLAEAETSVNQFFAEVRAVRMLPNMDDLARVEALERGTNMPGSVPRDAYPILLKMTEFDLLSVQKDTITLLRMTFAGVVRPEDVVDLRLKIDQDVAPYSVTVREPRQATVFIREVVKNRIRSNQIDDPETTQIVRNQAMLEVDPVMVFKGECCIVVERNRVTHEQIEMLKDLGLVGPRANLRSLVGTSLIAGLTVMLMAIFLIRYRPAIVERDRHLVLLGLIGLITLLLSLAMRAFSDTLGPAVPYLIPIAFNGMLVAILLDAKVAIVQSVLLSLVVGLTLQTEQLGPTLVMVVGSIVGIFSVARVESRTDIYRAGLLVSGVNAVTILAIYMMKAFSLLDLRIWIDAGVGAANGLVVAVLVTGALPFFENMFGVVTPLKLLELSNPNHPLLKKLLVEAPGSYHHTILVANLCEAAAEAIGADQTLSRVGAYFHDIGKAKRPYFFVENQFGGENPHDKLPPSLSAMIITSHVKDGLEMAKEARLPKEIVDFILEHHGTTLVSYFYHMATSKNGQSEFVLEADFRYEGPKPRTKETAICMLADGCEASVRAMRQKGHLTVDQIEAQVKRIVADRLQQGQLENCDLTLRELDVISRTFVKMLGGVHHARIDYPAEAIPARLTAPAQQPNTTGPEEATSVADLDQQRAEHPVDGAAGGDPPPGGPKDV